MVVKEDEEEKQKRNYPDLTKVRVEEPTLKTKTRANFPFPCLDDLKSMGSFSNQYLVPRNKERQREGESGGDLSAW
jgi:hypothetical protein